MMKSILVSYILEIVKINKLFFPSGINYDSFDLYPFQVIYWSLNKFEQISSLKNFYAFESIRLKIAEKLIHLKSTSLLVAFYFKLSAKIFLLIEYTVHFARNVHTASKYVR